VELHDYGAGLTDDEKLAKRTPIANSPELLMRGWWLGMIVSHDDFDREIYEAIGSSIDPPPDTPTTKVPIGIRFPKCTVRNQAHADSEGHRRVTDDDFLAAYNLLMHRADLLHAAYARGMFVATTTEQQQYLEVVDRELSR
jgi:hypothetical protein